MDPALQTFIVESRELLAAMEDALLTIGDGTDTRESVDAIFRAAHTIKGSAGLFGIQSIVNFTHAVESVLDRVRAQEVEIDDTLVSILLACKDALGRMVTQVEHGLDDPDDELTLEAAELTIRLGPYLPRHGAHDLRAAPDKQEAEQEAAIAAQHWHISLRFHENVLRNGMDPSSFVRYLQRLGTLKGLVCEHGRVPGLASLDPEVCYLGLEIGLETQAARESIEGAFEFVRDDCDIRIVPPASGLSAFRTLIDEIGEDPGALAEMFVHCGTLTAEAGDQLTAEASPLVKAGGTVLCDASALPPAASDAARQTKESGTGERRTVRVDSEKLDRLINLVGELITASAGACVSAAKSENTELQAASAQVASLVQEVRDSTLQLRMVRIDATFNRFRRVVHDVSRQLGKKILLNISGQDTELDKTVVEQIGDPLTHLVRNAIDHGIESADVRAAAGKPESGTISLHARHDSGHIVIEVEDDGHGLDRARILDKAIERGIIDADRALSDADVYRLIFEPGFSTASAVTDLSGRGVGMDVVKRNIEALRGSVEVESQAGLGTKVVIRLPLTLAIIDGFQVGVGPSQFVLPLDMVDECVAYQAEPGRDYTDLRGNVLPFVRLREIFSLGSEPSARENIVVVSHAGQRIGLVVDSLVGEVQAVIKPLSKIIASMRGISGSSILGSGDIALILDVPALMAEARRTYESGTRTPPSAVI